MPYHKLTTKQWEKFSTQISFSKQTVESLSKLYIIIHEKVKSSIKKAVINPQTNFSQEAQYHIQFIKNVLSKITDTQNDQYLVDVQQDMLRKYEKSLLGLLSQIQVMLKVSQSKINIDFESLKRLQAQKRKQYDLKDQIIRSKKRIVRAKSGHQKTDLNNHRHAKNTNLQTQNNLQITSNAFFPTTVQIESLFPEKTIIINEDQLFAKFEQKRKALDNKIKNTMSQTQNGRGISFHKKYQENNLQMYLQERKQFSDLIFNQQTYDNIISERESKMNLEKSTIQSGLNQNFLAKRQFKIEELNSKMFPQFQIKTKFMKPDVKQKISNLVSQIKKQLIQDYREANIKTLQNASEDTKALQIDVKKSHDSLSLRKVKSKRPFKKIEQIQTNDQMQDDYNKKSTQNRNINKMSFTNAGKVRQKFEKNEEGYERVKRCNSLKIVSKTSLAGQTRNRFFVNQNIRPFYVTQKWNEKVEKKYANQVISKLKLAKI